ncbi:MAG: hypothetical protein JWO05_1007 [Gemmatimonadetes bacterium]|nr:hypothetical protein [Gemmatimonadota bacterium]
MTKRLFRCIVLLNAWALVSFGMHVSRATSIHDAGGTLQAIDWLTLAWLTVLSICGTVALLQAPRLDVESDMHAPAA